MHLFVGEVDPTSVTREPNIFPQQVELQSRAGKSVCKGFEYPLPLCVPCFRSKNVHVGIAAFDFTPHHTPY